MKLSSIVLFLLPIISTPAPAVSADALRRELSHIENAADDLARFNLDVSDRTLRRRIAASVDELYEAAERMRLLLDSDTLPKPIRAEDLAPFIESVKKAGFGDTKVDMVKEFGRSNWFMVDQVGTIAEELPFGENKVEAILALYPHIVDKENAYRLYEFVTFSDDRDKLKKGIAELEGDTLK